MKTLNYTIRTAIVLWKAEAKHQHSNRAKEILASPKPEPVPKDIQKEISHIVKRCEEEFSKQG